MVFYAGAEIAPGCAGRFGLGSPLAGDEKNSPVAQHAGPPFLIPWTPLWRPWTAGVTRMRVTMVVDHL